MGRGRNHRQAKNSWNPGRQELTGYGRSQRGWQVAGGRTMSEKLLGRSSTQRSLGPHAYSKSISWTHKHATHTQANAPRHPAACNSGRTRNRPWPNPSTPPPLHPPRHSATASRCPCFVSMLAGSEARSQKLRFKWLPVWGWLFLGRDHCTPAWQAGVRRHWSASSFR